MDEGYLIFDAKDLMSNASSTRDSDDSEIQRWQNISQPLVLRRVGQSKLGIL